MPNDLFLLFREKVGLCGGGGGGGGGGGEGGWRPRLEEALLSFRNSFSRPSSADPAL